MTRQYNKYLVGVADRFDPNNYSSIYEEIRMINEKTDTFPLYFKVEMIISFLKDHSLQSNWIEANPELTQLVTSQTLFTGSIESLFDSCRNNPGFRQDLETYLRGKFSGYSPVKVEQA